jgi:hypothetical protein
MWRRLCWLLLACEAADLVEQRRIFDAVAIVQD